MTKSCKRKNIKSKDRRKTPLYHYITLRPPPPKKKTKTENPDIGDEKNITELDIDFDCTEMSRSVTGIKTFVRNLKNKKAVWLTTNRYM